MCGLYLWNWNTVVWWNVTVANMEDDISDSRTLVSPEGEGVRVGSGGTLAWEVLSESQTRGV